MISVLLVEDEPLWQEGVKALLATDSNLHLAAIVDNADDAETAFVQYSPDIVLIDWKIKGDRDGLDLAAALVSKIPEDKLILVTGSPQEQLPQNPYGYVPKPQIASKLIDEIKRRAL